MKSFKRMLISIVVFVIVLIVSAISINTLYVVPIRSDVDSINADMKNVNESLIEASFPIKVIENVTTMLSSDTAPSAGSKVNMMMAYDRNYNNALMRMSSAEKSVSDAILRLERVESSLAFGDSMRISEIISQLKDMRSRISGVEKGLATLKSMSTYKIQLSAVNMLETENNSLIRDFSSIDDRYSKTKGTFLSAYIMFVTAVFAALLIVILVLSYIIAKIVMRDIGFMSEALKKMNRFDFETDSLPDINPVFAEEKEIKRTVENIFKEQGFIKRVKYICGKGYILDDIVNHLFNEVQGVMSVDRIGIAFVDSDTRSIIAEYGVNNYGKVLIGPGFEVGMDETTLANMIRTKVPTIMDDIETELLKRPKSKSLHLLKKEGIASNMIIPLISDDSVFGFMFLASVKKSNFDQNDLQLALNIAHELSAIIDKTYLTKKMFSTITRTFSRLVEKKDNETGDHIARMTAYSTVIAEGLIHHNDECYKVDMAFVNLINNNAAVHDIGKVGIPDSILKKPGPLTDDEREIMKSHSAIGGDIMSEFRDSLKIFNKNFYQTAIDIARGHHEKWDGSGYPDGLSGKDIPLAARIVAVADVFDAVSSKRVYKAEMGFEESVGIINSGSGTHFDPEIVTVFNKNIERIRKIYDIR